jgi:hypothetical protein
VGAACLAHWAKYICEVHMGSDQLSLCFPGSVYDQPYDRYLPHCRRLRNYNPKRNSTDCCRAVRWDSHFGQQCSVELFE